MIQNIKIWLISLITFFVLFILLPSNEFTDLYKGHQAEKWPTVNGVVTASTDQVVRYYRGPSIDFAYSYEINSQVYSGKRYRFHSQSVISQEDINQIIEEHPAGSQITVHYSPENPIESVIVPGFIFSELISALCLSFPIVIFMVLFFVSFIIWARSVIKKTTGKLDI